MALIADRPAGAPAPQTPATDGPPVTQSGHGGGHGRPLSVLAFLCALSVLLAAAAAAAAAAGNAPTPATAAQWVSAGVAFLGVIVTGLAFGVTYRLFRQGRDDRRRAQAVKVWAETVLEGDRGRDRQLTYRVHNGSDEPVWVLEIRPTFAANPERNGQSRRARLDHDRERYPAKTYRDDPAGQRAVAPNTPLDYGPWDLLATDEPRLDPHPTFVFVDHAGRTWQRQGPELDQTR